MDSRQQKSRTFDGVNCNQQLSEAGPASASASAAATTLSLWSIPTSRTLCVVVAIPHCTLVLNSKSVLHRPLDPEDTNLHLWSLPLIASLNFSLKGVIVCCCGSNPLYFYKSRYFRIYLGSIGACGFLLFLNFLWNCLHFCILWRFCNGLNAICILFLHNYMHRTLGVVICFFFFWFL